MSGEVCESGVESRLTDGTVPAGGSGGVVPDCPAVERCSSEANEQVDGSYGPFITNGFIALGDGSNKIPVKILRDTGATESFVAETALPFSVNSSTGKSVLIRGIGMQTMSLPLHTIRSCARGGGGGSLPSFASARGGGHLGK